MNVDHELKNGEFFISIDIDQNDEIINKNTLN